MMRWKEEEMEMDYEKKTEPGKYMAEVKTVKVKYTAENDEMWGLLFIEPKTGDQICWDNLVFNKMGRPIALKKMATLGVPKEGDEYILGSKDELIGKRCWLHCKIEEYKGKERLVPDFNAGEAFGYEAEYRPQQADDRKEDDIPF